MITSFGAFIVPWIIGYLAGCLVVCISLRFGRKPDGYFFVNLVDPNDEMFKMQIDIPLEDLPKAKYLIFRVRKIQ